MILTLMIMMSVVDKAVVVLVVAAKVLADVVVIVVVFFAVGPTAFCSMLHFSVRFSLYEQQVFLVSSCRFLFVFKIFFLFDFILFLTH